ncbi:MAG: hypothetical protein GAK38_00768 [Xylophilus sp.]|nr:MAG: hypothetical protein GAK38_00768 [Xylophilus sp.]
MSRIVAYTYEAAAHCPACARRRFASLATGRADEGLDGHGIPVDAEDREGNRLHAVFRWDDLPDTHCDTCRAPL